MATMKVVENTLCLFPTRSMSASRYSARWMLRASGCAEVMNQPDFNLAGPWKVLSEAHFPDTSRHLLHRSKPASCSRRRAGAGSRRSRRGIPCTDRHEYLAKIAIETMDGRADPPDPGQTQGRRHSGRCARRGINTLTEKYFVKDTAIQAGYPMECVMPVRVKRCCTRFSARTSDAAT